MTHYRDKVAGNRDQVQGVNVWTDVGGIPDLWITDANWSQATDPVSGDVAVFNAGATDVIGGAGAYVSLDGLYVGEGYTGSLGTDGTIAPAEPTLSKCMHLNCQVVSIRKVKGWVALRSNVATPNIYINKTAVRDPAVLLAGPITNLIILEAHGQVELVQTGGVPQTAVENLVLCPRAGKYVRVKIGANCPVTNLRANGHSFVESASGTTTLTVIGGGECEFTGSAAHAAVTCANGGTVTHQSTGNVTGTLSVASRGLFQTDKTPDSALVIDKIEMWKGGTVDLRSKTRNVTVTSGAEAHGGVVLLDNGTTADF